MLEEEDERTSAVGLYHYAMSYHEAARALSNVGLKSPHGQAPIYYLYYHALELFLKAFIRSQGTGVKELRSKIGHNAAALFRRSTELGLTMDDEDAEILRMMAETDIVSRSRYIRTGYFSMPTLAALERTAASLRRLVRAPIAERTGVRLRP
jgi:hypothetical protein